MYKGAENESKSCHFFYWVGERASSIVAAYKLVLLSDVSSKSRHRVSNHVLVHMYVLFICTKGDYTIDM